MEITIPIASQSEAMSLFGLEDRNLKLIRESLPVTVTARRGILRLSGDKTPVEEAASLLRGILVSIRGGREVAPEDFRRQVEAIRLRLIPEGSPGTAVNGDKAGDAPRSIRVDGEPIEKLCRSPGQERYVRSILQHDLVFCIGPAGTGKTFLAVRMAINYLRAGDIRKIVLCRPAVEAGEKLGFLPGDFQAKINPYLRPLYDALNDILDYDQVKRFIEREIIEVIPLAYMRGRTLNNSFIILDEAQNTTTPQMKMFLTRMGETTKIVVNGDITQVDLPEGVTSGLTQARTILPQVEGLAWVELLPDDIVRHPLVRRIVEAYEVFETGPQGGGKNGRRG
jgi:phosphate starvation-inducible PhoH-like protein